MADDHAAEDAAYEAELNAEWGTYVANGPVYINGALAFTDGSPVPASTVQRFRLEDGAYVRRAGEPKPESAVLSHAAPQGADVVIEAADVAPAESVLPSDPELSEPPIKQK